jgi:hypothetical protein
MALEALQDINRIINPHGYRITQIKQAGSYLTSLQLDPEEKDRIAVILQRCMLREAQDQQFRMMALEEHNKQLIKLNDLKIIEKEEQSIRDDWKAIGTACGILAVAGIVFGPLGLLISATASATLNMEERRHNGGMTRWEQALNRWADARRLVNQGLSFDEAKRLAGISGSGCSTVFF